MRIVSWNVAGWQSTLQQLLSTYGSLEAFLLMLDADIFCVQEAKVPEKTLKDKPVSVAASVNGFDSFWACCAIRPETHQGRYSGCATWVRSGLTISAESAPLEGTESWADEGRCLLTDHGQVVVLNVYAPASGGGYRALEAKLSFLDALRQRVEALRAAGRSVVVCGDLNVAAAADVYPPDRIVSLGSLEGDYGSRVRETLDRAEVRAIIGKRHGGVAPMARQETSYRLYVPTAGGMVPFSTAFETELEAVRRCKDLGQQMVGDIVLKKEGHLAVRHIVEVLQKAHQIQLSATERKELEARGESYFPAAAIDALVALGLVDSFRAIFPDAESRFTAWQQYTNGRYTNEGARLDYIFLTPDLLPNSSVTGQLYAAGAEEYSSAAAALGAATAGGRWKEAPKTGGGLMQSENAEGAVDTIRESAEVARNSGCGIIYTAPRWSDHVAVTVKLQVDTTFRLDLLSDPKTKKAQPQRTWRSLNSFFSAPKRPAGAALSDTNDTNTVKSARQEISKPSQQPAPTCSAIVDLSSEDEPSKSAHALEHGRHVKTTQTVPQVVDLLSPPKKKPRCGTLDSWMRK